MIAFDDPAGMRLELIISDEPATFRFWKEGPIAEPHALRGFHSVTLWLSEVKRTATLLSEQLGYQFVGQEGERYRFKGASDNIGLYVDLLHRPNQPRARFGTGSIHHIAFRTVDDEQQLEGYTLKAEPETSMRMDLSPRAERSALAPKHPTPNAPSMTTQLAFHVVYAR